MRALHVGMEAHDVMPKVDGTTESPMLGESYTKQKQQTAWRRSVVLDFRAFCNAFGFCGEERKTNEPPRTRRLKIDRRVMKRGEYILLGGG